MAPIPETVSLPHDAAKRFEILRPLGASGPARVYLVRDRKLERSLVLTVVPLDALPPRAAEAIERRVRALVHLSHQNVVTFSYWDRMEGKLLYAVEPGEGQSMAKLFAQRPVALPEALKILAHVATGLAAVHGKGLAHGDLRAGKIFLSKGGIARLAGFRLASDGIDVASDVRKLAELSARVLDRCPLPPGACRPSALLALEALVTTSPSVTAARLRNALRAAHKALPEPPRRKTPAGSPGQAAAGTAEKNSAQNLIRTPVRTLPATAFISVKSAKLVSRRRFLPWACAGLCLFAAVLIAREGFHRFGRVGESAKRRLVLASVPPSKASLATAARVSRHDPPVVGVHRATRLPARQAQKATVPNGEWRHFRRLNELAKASRSLDARDPKKRTLLHYGVRALHRRTVDELLNRGASVNARDAYGRTPFHYASGLPAGFCRALLRRAGGNSAALSPYQRLLCRQDRLTPREMVRVLMARGAKLKTKDAKGRTPLHAAVLGASPDLVRFLVERGADLNACDNEGCGPLHLAAASARPLVGSPLGARSLAVLEHLVERGADVKAKDGRGRTPLHHACEAACREAVLILLIRQADVNARDRRGRTPLHYAAQRKSRQVIEALVAGDADADVRDHKGITPRVLIGSVPPPPWPRALRRKADPTR